ncbi:hypothetical protein ZWY2020_021015 [Hordeum vulgare]|nr:hypothetical protein ZWY2020_021015 [Hordeum vulgare]
MLRDGRIPPNKYTFPLVLKACSVLLDLRAGRAIHRHAAYAGLHDDLFVSTALIDLYMKCARFRPTNALFHAMPARAPSPGMPWSPVARSTACTNMRWCASSTCRRVAPAAGLTPPPSSCSFLCSPSRARSAKGSLCMPTESTPLSTTRTGCSSAPHCWTWNSLLSMYAKARLVDEATALFNDMAAKDTVSYSALVSEYVQNGMADASFLVFRKMQGGFLDEAYQFIQSMPMKSHIRVWGALLAAFRVHKNIDLGKQVVRVIQKLGPEGTGNFVLLSNIFSAAGRFDAAAEV